MRYAFAHRGGRAHGPENTIPTFAKALAAGATALETDAWVTADGYVVLDHDGLHRAGSPDQRPITEIARAELAGHIPTLADLYDSCGVDYDLAIDIKGDGDGAAISAVAEDRGAAGRLWLFTPSTSRPGAIGNAHAGVTVRVEELRDVRKRKTLLRSLQDEGIEVVNARWQFWTRAAVNEVHELGMLAFAWDVQRSVALWRCKRLKIDGIFSDHVHLLNKSRF
ncbi:MAG TPA: glycerophosphodiester phosphodiesterase [Mycobacteriales bacterium]|jgi:glycerophosphoryl diester phosphodiesterase|nr:glycerophosphodiester phosphodiesterase [Mycobacteriales bacterium]